MNQGSNTEPQEQPQTPRVERERDERLTRVLQRALAPGEHRGEEEAPSQPPGTHLMKEHRGPGVDHTVRLALLDYKERHGLFHTQLAKRLGLVKGGKTLVSRYLNARGTKEPTGNWRALESNARELLTRDAQRSDKEAPAPRVAQTRKTDDLWDTSVTQAVAGVLEVIKQTNDFALVHGPAGIGKTCGLAIYRDENSGTALITATMAERNASALISALVRAEKLGTGRKKGTYAQTVEDHFRGSDRLIIVDNAQRLSVSGLAWLFDFHDATGCAVALVGNPDVLEKIRPNDQFFSRVGLCEEVGIGDVKDAEEFACEMVRRSGPDGAQLVEVIGAEATMQLRRKGHARGLDKQLKLMRVFLGTKEFAGQPLAAFQSARLKLVSGATEGGDL